MVAVIWLFATLCLRVQAGDVFPKVDQRVVGNLDSYKIDIHIYENPVIRDHFVYTGLDTKLNFSEDFKFEDYRYDGYIATVLSPRGYKYLMKNAPQAKDLMLAVYHGYHKDMKHNHFSKPWEPSVDDHPVFYCSRRNGFLNATERLWTLDGQPIDETGDLGYDTIYTTTLIERDLPNFEDYVMYRILCNTWQKPELGEIDVRNARKFGEAEIEVLQSDMYIHQYSNKLRRVYQFYNEQQQDHYYKLEVRNTTKDRANYKNIVAMVFDEHEIEDITDCKNGSNLAPLIQAYDPQRTDHVLFVGEEKLREVERKESIQLTNIKILGYVAKTKDDCFSRYQLNIRVRSNSPDHRDVYIAPNNYGTNDPLFYGQTFFIW